MKNKTIKIISILSLVMIIFSLSTFAYYTNISKFFVEQQNVYVDGEGQHRLAEDFIEDGVWEWYNARYCDWTLLG
ncbi:MAG: hypothetical protein PF569_03150 [Candidatus Woesearchaeota archaeon]|nr:hypothetical protein [Candidatus Woesearchaeota archaeon]